MYTITVDIELATLTDPAGEKSSQMDVLSEVAGLSKWSMMAKLARATPLNPRTTNTTGTHSRIPRSHGKTPFDRLPEVSL